MYQSFQDPNNNNKSSSTNNNKNNIQNDYYPYQDAELSYQYQNASPSHSTSQNVYNEINNARAEINMNKNRPSRSCIPFAAIATTALFIILLPGIIMNNMKSSNIVSNLNMISTTSTNKATSSSFLYSSTTSAYSITPTVISPGYESAPLASLSLLPWDVLAEPARIQILSISSMTIDNKVIDITPYSDSIVWTIQPPTSSSGSSSDSKRKLKKSGSTKKSNDNDSVMKMYGNDQKFQINSGTNVRKCSVSITLPTTAITSNKEVESEEVKEVVDAASEATTTAETTSSDNSNNNKARRTTTTPTMTTFTQEFTMAVKYVRRELRSLTEADRVQFFQALYSLYTVPVTEGQAKYGSKFNTAEYFVYKHLNGAGTSDCDHWHDGGGIVTHHVAFTLEVEQALQAVNPAVAMPYWEYSMDPYLYTHWWESPVFSKDWFGEATPKNDNHILQDGGMWEGILMPDGTNYKGTDFWSIKETGSLNPFVNAYGILRSPWNNNPNQAIGRTNLTYSRSQYTTMPTCKTMYSCFMSESASDMNDCLNGGTHGPVHIMIGGSWGEGSVFEAEGTDDKFDALTLVHNADKLLFFKVLWRMGYTRCPSTCSGFATVEECKCSVPQEYVDKYGAYYILEKANIVYGVADALTDADDEVYLKLLKAVEDPGVAGEMFSSAAAYDPTFWPLHGAMERMVGLKRILVSQGDVTNFDATWGFKEYDKSTKAAYLNGVCDWSGVSSNEDLTLPVCNMGQTCYGHNENDLLEFSGFVSNGSDSEEEVDVYTNGEFLNFIHPWNEELPYTYDTFDYDYCMENGGFDFFAPSTLNDTADPMVDVGGGDVLNIGTMVDVTLTAPPLVIADGGGDGDVNAPTTVVSETILVEPIMSSSSSIGKISSKNVESTAAVATAGDTPATVTASSSVTTTTTSTQTNNKKTTTKTGGSTSTSPRYTYKGFAAGQNQPEVKRVYMTAAEAHKITTQPVAVNQKWQQVLAAARGKQSLESSAGTVATNAATAASTTTSDKHSS